MKRTSPIRPVLIVLISFAVFWSALHSLGDVITRGTWFHLTGDESLHAEVIEVLSRTGQFRVWTGPLFPAYLTSGPALTVFSALIKVVTGLSGSVAGRLTSFSYYIGCWFLLIGMVRLQSKKWSRDQLLVGSLVVIGFFHIQWRGLQDNFYYPFAILGEQAMIFWILLATWAHLRGNVLLSGIASGLALLSKPYVVFLVPIWVLILAFHRETRKSALRYLLGVFFPWSLWVGWMVCTMGPVGALQYWLRYPEAIRLAGNPGMLSEGVPLSVRIAIVPEILNRKGMLAFAVGIFSALWLGRKLRAFLPLTVFAFFHLAWWFWKAPTPSPRYFVPVYLIFCLANVLILLKQLDRVPFPKQLGFAMRSSLIFALIAPLLIRVVPEVNRILSDRESYGFTRQLILQREWEKMDPRPTQFLSVAQVDYAHEVDTLMVGPHTIQRVAIPNLRMELKPGTWVIMGESSDLAATPILESAGCQKRAGTTQGPYGIWAC